MNGFQHPDTTRTWDELYYKEPPAIRYYDQAIHTTLELLRAHPGDRLLDAGCGAGVHAVRAARFGCRVDAVDISTAALEDARSRVRTSGLPDDAIRFAQEDLTQLTFQDHAYDKIFSWGVIIHIPAIEQALDELARILAPGGRLALYVSNFTSLLNPPSRESKRLPLGYGTYFELHGERIWVWFNDVPAIVRYLSSHGLKLLTRRSGEFSGPRMRLPPAMRRMVWRFNNLWFRLNLPPQLAHTNLLVFQKD